VNGHDSVPNPFRSEALHGKPDSLRSAVRVHLTGVDGHSKACPSGPLEQGLKGTRLVLDFVVGKIDTHKGFAVANDKVHGGRGILERLHPINDANHTHGKVRVQGHGAVDPPEDGSVDRTVVPAFGMANGNVKWRVPQLEDAHVLHCPGILARLKRDSLDNVWIPQNTLVMPEVLQKGRQVGAGTFEDVI
jgi:hypothetical protein